MSVRITQETVQPLAIGGPSARITQEATEVLAEGLPNARITQQAILPLAIGNAPFQARITQQAVIFLGIPLNIGPGNPGAIGVGSESTGADMFYPIPPQVSTR
jgi:hypothetical protein